MNTDKLMELVADAVKRVTGCRDITAGDLSLVGEVTAAIAALRDGTNRDREADRARFPDADFNRWLDEGISDCGHIVWHQIGDVADAWAAWDSRPYYTKRQQSLEADELAAALRAEQAVGTARQSEGVVLISEDDRQLAIRGARSMKECADEHDGLTTEALLMYSGLLSRVAVAGRPVPDPKSLVILADAALRELGRIHEMLDDAIAKCELAKAEPTEGAVVAPIWREVEAMMVEFKAAWPSDTSKSRRARANALCERFLRLRNHLRGWNGDKIESAWLAAAPGGEGEGKS